MAEKSQIEIINAEINKELGNESVSRALLATTFKGLTPVVMKQAIMDGMIRGFSFLNFRQKDVYAIPYGASYSLVTSIDYSRKIGMRSGIVGVKAPVYEMDGEKIVSCAVTVQRKIGNYIGDYTATVYFDEYTTKRNLWTTKPRTMIAKVAEMHALRKACPEELSQQYIEEEMELETKDAFITRTEEIKGDQEKLSMGAVIKETTNDETKNKDEITIEKEEGADAAAFFAEGVEEDQGDSGRERGE